MYTTVPLFIELIILFSFRPFLPADIYIVAKRFFFTQLSHEELYCVRLHYYTDTQHSLSLGLIELYFVTLDYTFRRESREIVRKKKRKKERKANFNCSCNILNFSLCVSCSIRFWPSPPVTCDDTRAEIPSIRLLSLEIFLLSSARFNVSLKIKTFCLLFLLLVGIYIFSLLNFTCVLLPGQPGPSRALRDMKNTRKFIYYFYFHSWKTFLLSRLVKVDKNTHRARWTAKKFFPRSRRSFQVLLAREL